MDAYEATKIVYSRIQGVDPDNAANIMGQLLIQDHGEKEMIRLAFGPEALVQSVVLKARKDLGLLPATPTTPSSPCPFSRQSSSASSLPSPSSWAASPQVFSRANNANANANAVLVDDVDILGGSSHNLSYGAPNNAFYGGGGGDPALDELQIQEQLSFLNESGSSPSYPDLAEYGWGAHPHHRRSCSMADLYDGGFGWKPCLYFARGFCKNGSTCRFHHGGFQDDATGGKMDAVVEQQCHELLLRSKTQRQLMGSPVAAAAAVAASFPYGSSLPSPTGGGKCINFLLQQQQSESQRAAMAALMLDEPHKFMGRSRLDRIDYATMANPGSRQIYLTFPADSTFREEDVSNYFSIYGPVQDVRIPYQQKRMFGFVTFVYPETVKLILAKGNPHFVCDARVLVKPYKEKGKLPDKKHHPHHQHQQQQMDRGDFSGCTTPTGLDSRDPYELQQLGARILFNSSQEVLLRRKLEEQQQAADLQQAIELQSRRFMGLQLLDLKSRGLSLPVTSVPTASPTSTPTTTTTPSTTISSSSAEDAPLSDDKCPSPVAAPDAEPQPAVAGAPPINPAPSIAGEEESMAEKGNSTNQDSDSQESAEHNLPDSPFASPTKSSSCFNEVRVAEAPNAPTSLHSGSRLLPATPTLDTTSFKSCFLSMPRFSPGHGAVGM